MRLFARSITYFLFLITFFFSASPAYSQLASPQDEYFKGKVAGEQEGKSVATGLWFLIGCVGGPIWAYAIDPEEPSSMAMMGKSMEYMQGYNEGYKKTVKAGRVKNAWIGFVAGGVVCCVGYIILYFIAISSTPSSSSSSYNY